MNFDARWENIHAKGRHSKYPSEHFLRFFWRYFAKMDYKKEHYALDLGCGWGAQTGFLAHNGFLVTAIDGSQTAVNVCSVIPRVAAWKLDLAKFYWPELGAPNFDLVVDVCTLQHLSLEVARRVISVARGAMKDGGLFFSLTATSPWTLDCEMQPRLTDESEVYDMFTGFRGKNIGYEMIQRPNGPKVSHLIVEAIK